MVCIINTNIMLNPITFCIPKEKICGDTVKTKIVSSLIPGKVSTYTYHTEQDYYTEYKSCYFAITTKKAGWDCMRHYEILANGCIPCFIDIDKCPVNTLYLLPKNLLLEANTLYERFIHKTIEDLTKEDVHEYTLLQQQLLEYTKQHLTTDKMSLYILKKTNNEHVSKILYLSGDTMPDYL